MLDPTIVAASVIRLRDTIMRRYTSAVARTSAVRACAALCVALSIFSTDAAQRQNAPRTFEVASIKPNVSGEPLVGLGIQPGGLMVAENVTLQVLIQNVNRVQAFQVLGGPDWIRTDRFDVTRSSP